MRGTLALLLATGCAQLLGIDETSGPKGAASLALDRVSVGATVVTAPLDLAAPPEFVLGDGSEVAGAAGEAGTWTTTSSGTAAMIYTAPDLPMPYQHDLALGAAVQGNFIAFEHPDPRPAPGASIVLAVTLPGVYAAGESFEIAAIGAWTQHVLAGGELPTLGASQLSASIPYTSFTATTSSPPARIAMADAVLVLRYDGAALSGVFIAPPFDQSDTSDTLSGTMIAVTADTQLSAMIDPTTVATRFDAVVPAGSTPGLAWQLAAAPGYAAGVTTGVTLLSGAPAMTDTTFSGSYANPLATLGWKPALTYVASASRTVTLGGATVALGTELAMVVDPGAGLVLDLPAGLPTMTSLAGMPLTSDGMTLSVDPGQPLPVAITADKPDATLYHALVEELAVVGTSATQTPVIDLVGTSPMLTLPPNVLQRGHTYAIVASCVQGGYPNAGSGDLRTFALPLAIGSATSAAFTIAP
ncbi:MAG TPA: hypothetical protein VLX92_19890 [Kofleriaceae bacterium]|nr:hypothetical protein [Kofleriaceae bacterium]